MSVKRIQVVPYNPDWPVLFEREAVKIKSALEDLCIVLHHVGSTSVPGLSAKPVIDIIAVVAFPEKTIPMLESLGFQYKGEYNIPFRFYFNKKGSGDVNLHVYEERHPEVDLNLMFRDYLRQNTESRDAYAVLKADLLTQQSSFEKNNGFTGYNLGKNSFIQNILRKSGFDEVRFVKCLHHAEWDFARFFRQKYFFDKAGVIDPYTWTFNHSDHRHFVLYKGTKAIGYAHVQLWPKDRAALRIIGITESDRNQGFGENFLYLIEKWLKNQKRKSFHVESSPDALSFYQKYGYVEMPFDNPEEEHTDATDISIGKIL